MSVARALIFLIWITTSASTGDCHTNRTVDDRGGIGLTYLPAGKWAQAPCRGCMITTDLVHPQNVKQGSWHDSTYHHGDQPHRILFDFSGIAVYVYHIVVNQGPKGVTTLTNLTFYLNDTFTGNFCHVPDGTHDVQYDFLVYANTTLPDHNHTLEIRADGPNNSLILFDYLIYTSTDKSLSLPLSSPMYSSPQSYAPSSSPASQSSTMSSSPMSPSPQRGVPHISPVVLAVAIITSFLVAVIIAIACRRRRLPKYTGPGTQGDDDGQPRKASGVASADSMRSTHSGWTSLSPAIWGPLILCQPSQAAQPLFPFDGVTQPGLGPPSSHDGSLPVGGSAATLLPDFGRRRPPAHRADVPVPALSATGSDHSQRLEALHKELIAVEGEVEQWTRKLMAKERQQWKKVATRSDLEKTAITSLKEKKLVELRARLSRVRAQAEVEERLLKETVPKVET